MPLTETTQPQINIQFANKEPELNKFKTKKDEELRRKIQKNLRYRLSSANLPRFSADSAFRPEYFLLRRE